MMPDRALALLAGRAVRFSADVRSMRDLASVLPMEIRIEVNNLQEVLDLLRHKIREATLCKIIHSPPPIEAKPPQPVKPKGRGHERPAKRRASASAK